MIMINTLKIIRNTSFSYTYFLYTLTDRNTYSSKSGDPRNKNSEQNNFQKNPNVGTSSSKTRTNGENSETRSQDTNKNQGQNQDKNQEKSQNRFYREYKGYKKGYRVGERPTRSTTEQTFSEFYNWFAYIFRSMKKTVGGFLWWILSFFLGLGGPFGKKKDGDAGIKKDKGNGGSSGSRNEKDKGPGDKGDSHGYDSNEALDIDTENLDPGIYEEPAIIFYDNDFRTIIEEATSPGTKMPDNSIIQESDNFLSLFFYLMSISAFILLIGVLIMAFKRRFFFFNRWK